MKLLVVLAFLFAIVAVCFLIATVFTTGGTMVYLSISAGLALAAFIILFVAYVNRSVK
jgi:hypothetical protein